MPHIHEKIDYAADAYIVNGDAVLLRYHEKYDAWLPPGGHIELDEDPEEAAVREAKEETGLDIELRGYRHPSYAGEKELMVPRFANRHAVSGVHEHISFMYLATSDTRDLSPQEGEVTAKMHWFTREDLRDPSYGVWDRVRIYAETALNELSPAHAQPEVGFYRHYKYDPSGARNNYTYEMLGLVRHTEDKTYLVRYRPLYETTHMGVADSSVRPLAMWLSSVEKGGNILPRFTRITDPAVIRELEQVRVQMYGA